jgi:hypothetical protein
MSDRSPGFLSYGADGHQGDMPHGLCTCRSWGLMGTPAVPQNSVKSRRVKCSLSMVKDEGIALDLLLLNEES